MTSNAATGCLTGLRTPTEEPWVISPHTSRTRAQGSRLRMSCLVGTTRAGPLGRRVESTRRTRSHPRARGRRRLAPRRGRRRRTRETRAVARADPARVTRRRVVLARRAVRRRRAVRPRPRALDLVSAPRDACPIRGGDERRVRHRRPRVRRLRRHRRPRRRGDAAAERVWTRLHRVLRLVLPARREEARQPRERVPRREHPAGAPSPPHPHAPRRRRVIDATSVKGCVRDSTGHLRVFFPHAHEHLPTSLRPSLRLLS